MRKYGLICFIILFMFPSRVLAEEEQDGRLKLETGRLENVYQGTTVKDDIYTQYGIRLFDAQSKAQAEKNHHDELVAKQALQRQLFNEKLRPEHHQNDDLEKLFVSSYQSEMMNPTVKESLDGNVMIYGLMAGVLIIVVVLLMRFSQF